MNNKVIGKSLFTDYDIYLFREGKHYHLYNHLGSHVVEHEGEKGVYFAVWAPNANQVSVIGDFNGWNNSEHILNCRMDSSGIWEGFIPGLDNGTVYKYHIKSNYNGYEVDKGDPYAFLWEIPPKTASVVWDIDDYDWKDKKWMDKRKKRNPHKEPFAVYEVHIGSWKRNQEDGFRSYHYRELAEELPQYVKEMGYTHVEFMPVMEHPFFGSWGYQITGYFAPSSRYGTPQDFMALVEALHKEGIGVIVDWVPSHFPTDEHGLAYFDGSHLYEHADMRKGFHPDWKSYIFNFGRNEVVSFLISNALFWLDKFHIDGQRMDGVASILFLDYSREEGEWIPNEFGGRENLEAIDFLKRYNEVLHGEYPDIVTIAEESTAFPMVSRPTYIGGLGFDMKWMMGWMHDTLEYFAKDPIHRQYHQNDITFSILYAFTENFLLPLSHDEVVHGKGPLIYKMPGDDWQRFANLRLLYSYMYGHPGTNMLFMGGEFGQSSEWKHDTELDWWLLDHEPHQGIQKLVKELNSVYKNERALYDISFEADGFEWIDASDYQNSIMVFARKDQEGNALIIACNFTPTVHQEYRIGVPEKGKWKEIFNSDHKDFGGSNVLNNKTMASEDVAYHGKDQSISVSLPPLGAVYLKLDEQK